eukprot:CAMPEP_0179294738 /NCGR_PEP_ID=MMETSP0797-20121207/44061_1 /TAXON_ID=47934 /ORGANISM="Dinophysis acuminata, Strain DAEP01" /LENGTH=122 /DNA_ID=CAMNT_0021003961 /DNA_START=56 /DNA_END=420 /DNA_ORIENTATION=-
MHATISCGRVSVDTQQSTWEVLVQELPHSIGLRFSEPPGAEVRPLLPRVDPREVAVGETTREDADVPLDEPREVPELLDVAVGVLPARQLVEEPAALPRELLGNVRVAVLRGVGPQADVVVA